MEIDGITLSAAVQEISRELAGTKIDRVQSPTRDSILISAGRGRSGSLLISASPSGARAHLTIAPPSSLPEPTTFCMLLRKHLVGGRIVEARQEGLDRILALRVEGWADSEPSQNKLLIAEMMGRRSNMILTDMDGRILDAVHRVDQSVNRYREILPGVQYIPPPPIDRPSPMTASREEFAASLARFAGRTHTGSIAEAVWSSYSGLGRVIGAELAFKAGLDPKRPAAGLGGAEIERLWKEFSDFCSQVRSGMLVFEAAFDKADGAAIAFCPCGLSHQAASHRIEAFGSACAMLDSCYSGAEASERLAARKRTILREAATHLERARRKLATQRDELASAQSDASLRRSGELLTASLNILGRGPMGRSHVLLVDYYDPDMPEVEIEVDPTMSASQNAQAIFARYARSRRAIETISANLASTESEAVYLEGVHGLLEMADSEEEFSQIVLELEALGYVEGAGDAAGRAGAKRGTRGSKAGRGGARGRSGSVRAASTHMPSRIQAESGHVIYVGRNNLQNDQLTMKLARDGDLWFHAKDVSGSHVVIRRRGAEQVPQETIYAAAMLAAYYSRARMSSNAPVDYTEKRNVHKPRGARPGMVVYENHRTIWVTPSREELSKALGLGSGGLAWEHDDPSPR
ncbi:MAG: NFACT RNA binding domain-containing protein [Clostridia bacterium]|nr:NFACT RNA binding domain-containing protein [Clostridia bacterium]